MAQKEEDQARQKEEAEREMAIRQAERARREIQRKEYMDKLKADQARNAEI